MGSEHSIDRDVCPFCGFRGEPHKVISCIQRLYDGNAELRAGNARLTAEVGSLRRLSSLGWDVSEVGKLKSQIVDRDNLLRNENELYRQATERADKAEAENARLREALEKIERNCVGAACDYARDALKGGG